MAFFSSGADREKLLILYAIRRVGFPITQEQLAEVLLDRGLDNFLTLSLYVSELEANAYLATIPAYGLRTIVLTKHGEEVIALFEKTLPRSNRDSIDECADAKAAVFRRDNASQVRSKFNSDDSFSTVLSLVENGDAFFEIKIKLPAAKYTEIASRRWSEINQKLYFDTLLALTTDPPPVSGTPSEPSEQPVEDGASDAAEPDDATDPAQTNE